MLLDFSRSRQSSVGIEWEVGLVDAETGELVAAAEQLLDAVGGGDSGPVRKEFLQTMVELVTGVHDNVGAAVADLADTFAKVRAVARPLGVAMIGSGTHPFSRSADQPRFTGERYDLVAERNQYWARQMAICGTHVHVGVDDPNKALVITNALARFYPFLLGLSCSSPFWEGEDSGYASQRTMLFQQLPTNSLPYPMSSWADFEAYAEEVYACGMASVPGEIRWDIRPSPAFGTVENRIADSVPTFAELGSLAALTQCLVEHISRSYPGGEQFETLPPWLVRENKWRAARYGLDAEIITVDKAQRTRPLTDALVEWVERLMPVANDLGCVEELGYAAKLAHEGASYQRQRRAGGPREALRLLVSETGQPGPLH